MHYVISHPDQVVKGIIRLPASKSISNRALVLQALSDSRYPVRNLSDSDDTRAMEKVLRSNASYFDIGHAGTTMRFLTAFLSRIMGEWTLTGSERMKQRPIGVLVDALRELGARIDYLGEAGYPPLKIWGSRLKGKVLELDGSISSQFVSALLMIGPAVEGGLTLKFTDRVTSRSYIELTLKLMERFGIRHEWLDRTITVPQQDYRPAALTVEGDWSGASYWYEIIALSREGEAELLDLHIPGMQGDAVIAHWFEAFGVASRYTGHSVVIRKTEDRQPGFLRLNFIENPDIAQTMAVLCVLKKVPFHFTGLETLKIKETDRITALQRELAKFGAEIREPAHGELSWDATFSLPEDKLPVVRTCHDHRMALAFAPAALCRQVAIDDPMVVTKSYPSYYDDLKQVGFRVDRTGDETGN